MFLSYIIRRKISVFKHTHLCNIFLFTKAFLQESKKKYIMHNSSEIKEIKEMKHFILERKTPEANVSQNEILLHYIRHFKNRP